MLIVLRKIPYQTCERKILSTLFNLNLNSCTMPCNNLSNDKIHLGGNPMGGKRWISIIEMTITLNLCSFDNNWSLFKDQNLNNYFVFYINI